MLSQIVETIAMAITQSSRESFKQDVLDYQGIVFVDFYADWCGPCKAVAPIIDQLAEANAQIKFVKVNVDENQDLATTYSVFSIPTFVLFKDGKVISQFSGAMNKEGFEEEIRKVMGQPSA